MLAERPSGIRDVDQAVLPMDTQSPPSEPGDEQVGKRGCWFVARFGL